VRSKTFIEEIKKKFGILVKGRKALGQGDLFQLHEPLGLYDADLYTKIEDTDLQNTYFWRIS